MNNNYAIINNRSIVLNDEKKRFKRELVDVFRKFGYLMGELDHEVTFRTTSGNIAWINIKKIEVIK
ncbi:MAG: hypothetical protein AB1499_03485 [Nitrospirota bacterium]